MTTLHLLVLFSAVVVLLFGYRQFNQWTEAETRSDASDSELLAYAPPKSFTSFGRFLVVALFYCLTLLAFYAVLYLIFANPPLAAGLLKDAGVTPQNAWLAALFVVTGLSPILPGFANVEHAVRQAMHAWAVVPGKAHQMADEIASPGTAYAIDARHIREVVLPRVSPALSADDFSAERAVTPAAKWARLNYLLYKFAPPAEAGLMAHKFKSPYTTRFHEDFVSLKRHFEEVARSEPELVRANLPSPVALALSERIDHMLHRLYVLMCCRAFASTKSWEGALQYLKRSYGVIVGTSQGASFPTGPMFDLLATIGGAVLLASIAYPFFVPEARGQINPFVWSLSALATHGIGVLVAWLVFQQSRKREESAFHRGTRAPISREWIAVVVVVSYTLSLLPTWLATLRYLLTAWSAQFADKPLLQIAAIAFETSWPWAFLGVATGLAAYVHMERTANALVTWRVRIVSAVAQGLINTVIAVIIVAAHTPASMPAARSLEQRFEGPIVPFVLFLTAMIGVLLGLFLPSALYRQGRDRRGGAHRIRVGEANDSRAVLTFAGQQVEARLAEISITGCVVDVPLRSSHQLLGRQGNVTFANDLTVPAFAAYEVRAEADSARIALGFSSERRYYYLPRHIREPLRAFVKHLNRGKEASPAVVPALATGRT